MFESSVIHLIGLEASAMSQSDVFQLQSKVMKRLRTASHS